MPLINAIAADKETLATENPTVLYARQQWVKTQKDKDVINTRRSWLLTKTRILMTTVPNMTKPGPRPLL